MRNPHDRGMSPLGHFADRPKDTADVGVFVAVDCSHVRTDGIDDDEANVAYLVDRPLKQRKAFVLIGFHLYVEIDQSILLFRK